MHRRFVQAGNSSERWLTLRTEMEPLALADSRNFIGRGGSSSDHLQIDDERGPR